MDNHKNLKVNLFMIDNNIVFILLTCLITLQSMAGVGILVLGTPLLLLIDYNMIDIMGILLPLSILTSLINFLYFKLKNKKMNIEIDSEIKKYLFLTCGPSIIIGLIILKLFDQYINFNLFVSVIIISSIYLVIKLNKKILNAKKNLKIFSLSLVGLIHGITNSGGTLLSLFVSGLQKNKINQSRYNITFAYLFLAIFQYISFLIIFETKYGLNELKLLFLVIPLGVILGNLLVKFISEKLYKIIINILAIISAFFLILKI
jgi:uncharacterized protein